MRHKIKRSTEWLRLASLIVKVVQYDKDEGLLEILLPQAIDERERKEIFIINSL